MQQLGDDRAALAGILPHHHGVVEAPRLLQYRRLLEAGVRRHVGRPGVVVVVALELVGHQGDLADDGVEVEGILALALLRGVGVRHGGSGLVGWFAMACRFGTIVGVSAEANPLCRPVKRKNGTRK